MFFREWRKTPKLLMSYGATRWVRISDNNPIFVNSLYDEWSGPMAYWGRNSRFQTTEMDSFHRGPDFKMDLYGYRPSLYQYWSPRGFILTWPFSFSIWWQSERLENPTLRGPSFRKIFFFRIGAEWLRFYTYKFPSAYIGNVFT